MLQFKSHQIPVTTAMQQAALTQFSYIPTNQLQHLRLKIESLNNHKLKLKALYQLPKQKPLIAEVATDDFYKGVEHLAKKMKNALHRQTDKRRGRQNKKLALGIALMEPETPPTPDQEVVVPIYRLTPEEALYEFEALQTPVYLYEDSVLDCLCTLTRLPDGRIEKQIVVE